MTYINNMSPNDKPLIWLHGEISTPPFSKEARIECGYLLRQLQKGIKLSLPQSRPMPSISHGCHEIRITDKNKIWRIIYRIDLNEIIIIDVFEKKTQKTPQKIIEKCKKRIKIYDSTE